MKIKPFLITLLTLLSATSCLEEQNPAFDEKAFTKIYDNTEFDASYYPIDVQQTSEGGYLILGGRRLENSSFAGIYILKADKLGNFVRDYDVDESYVNPVGDFMKIGATYYFLCMDPLTLQTHIASVDMNGESFTAIPVASSLPYPAAASTDGNSILALSYNHVNKESVVSVIATAGTVSASNGYSIGAGEGVEQPLVDHFLRTGYQFPFQVGQSGSQYFFNGFYNYTFSLVFVDLSQNNPTGVVQGQQDDGGFSALLPLSGSTFAASRFNFGDNYLLPNVDLNTSGISSSTDLGGFSLPELDQNAVVRIIRATIQSQDVLVYGCNTKSNQIGLYFYNASTGAFISSQYLGYSYPFEISAVKQTAEGDLIVCGTTYVTGRFPRFSLIKIAGDQIHL
ncbi:MAG: hypothetical protein HC811_10620 [Flammeovirgaceae bacterium]|nr:hypothetical protein [Flammeovirgaceae bacterium]